MTAPAIALGVLILASSTLASDKRVEVDPKTDFSLLKTFSLEEGRASSRQPEIHNSLTLRMIENVVRTELIARGLKETADRPDLVVTFSVTEGGQRGAPPPGQRGVLKLSAGTLIIDMTRRDMKSLVWHGVYSDVADSPGTLASRLPGGARKLLSDFPPKKK